MTVRRVDQPAVAPQQRTDAPAAPAAPAATNQARSTGASAFGGSTQNTAALGTAAPRPSDHVASAMAPGAAAAPAAPGPLSLNSREAKEAINKSLDYINQNMGLNLREAQSGASGAFSPRVVEKDELGMAHVRLDRTHEGLKVFGEQVVSHIGADGQVQGLTGDVTAIPAGLGSEQPKISEKDAREIAKGAFADKLQRPTTVEKIIYKAPDGTYKVGYRAECINFNAAGGPKRMNYLIDGATGQIDQKWNQMGGIEIPPKALATATPITVKGTATPNATIPDMGKAESTITIGDDVSVESLKLGLDIDHTYKGDLVVTLTSPSGKSAVVSNRQGGSADNIKQTFDLSAFAGESSKGDWKITVEDKARADVGKLNAWQLEITGTPKTPPPSEGGVVEKSTSPNAAIEDNKTVTSTIDVAESGTVDQLALNLDIDHTYQGDLQVKLTSPSGKTAIVHNRTGGSTDNIKGSFDLSEFAGEDIKGQWKLEVSDQAAQDTGKLNSWGLKITKKGDQPPPPPPPPPGGADDQTLYAGKVDLGGLQKKADGTYALNDSTRGKGVEVRDAMNKSSATGSKEITDNNNAWGEAGDPTRNKAAVDAMYGAQMTADMYKNVLGRDSIDGKGEKLLNNVHINNNYVNAYWDGTQMNYGDGDGRQATALTTIDIAGHEITHGLTERTAGLVYSGESGGLNEAMSDIMGTGVEWYASQHNAAVQFDWKLGEDCWTPGTAGDALRYMDDPTKDNYSVDNYKNYPKQTEVHGSSGIANNAFYLLTQGGKNRTSQIEVKDGIGMDKSLKIFGRALMFYMTPNTNFAGAREATIKAATDLYGANSTEVQKVKESWTAVGVN